jgi:hypothetical protein
MQVLLSQGVIPCTVICSIILLSKRFHLLQYAGAGLIVGGIVLAKLATASGGQVGAGDEPFFNLCFFLACLPAALSSVFKEVAFRGYDGDLDVNVLQFWVAVFQAFVTFAAMPIYSLSVLGPQQVPLSQMTSETINGARCLFLFEDKRVSNCGGFDQKPCDHCEDAWYPVSIYFVFNIAFNILQMLVIKHGSATLSFLIATMRMPLASIAFSMPMIMGKDAVQPTVGDVACLTVIIGGLSLYRYGGSVLKRQLEETSAASSPSTWLLSPSPKRTSSTGTMRPDSPNRSPGGLLRQRTFSRWRFVPQFAPGINPQPVFIYVPEARPQPRSSDRVRTDFLNRLGAASPLHSPKMRMLTPQPRSPASGCSSRTATPPRFHSPGGEDRHVQIVDFY